MSDAQSHPTNKPARPGQPAATNRQPTVTSGQPTGFPIDPAEERMLLTIRDTLYEGSWEDFALDLRARLEGKPHVFAVQPPSPKLRNTISHHLSLIEKFIEQGK